MVVQLGNRSKGGGLPGLFETGTDITPFRFNDIGQKNKVEKAVPVCSKNLS
jgi:hypothetical protein